MLSIQCLHWIYAQVIHMYGKKRTTSEECVIGLMGCKRRKHYMKLGESYQKQINPHYAKRSLTFEESVINSSMLKCTRLGKG